MQCFNVWIKKAVHLDFLGKLNPIQKQHSKSVLKILSKYTGGHPWRSVISIKLQSSPPKVFLGKCVLKECINLRENTHAEAQFQHICDFNKITLWQWCSPVNVLHVFKAFFPMITSGGCFCLFKDVHIKPIYQQKTYKYF